MLENINYFLYGLFFGLIIGGLLAMLYYESEEE